MEEPPPRTLTWPWLLALLVAAAWWPIGSYWQSDDYLALHYTTDWTRTLSDFGGNQYGLPSLVWFYRPLITLSFALDSLVGTALGGMTPLVSHASNALAQGISAMLVGQLAARFFGSRGTGWGAGLIWGLSPIHASSVYWAVGRVDSHTTVWILLSALLLVRYCDEQRDSRIPSLLCFLLALCSKETAMVLPGVAVVLSFALTPRGESLPRRLKEVVQITWPYFFLLLLYLGWRYLLFERWLGGYEGGFQPQAALGGLGQRTLECLNPMMHSGREFCEENLFAVPDQFYLLGFLPPAAGLLLLILAKRYTLLIGLLLLFLGTVVPAYQILHLTQNPMNLRYFCLPMVPLAMVLAAGSWRTALPALLVAALPFCELRDDYQKTWQRCGKMHRFLLEEGQDLGEELNFISGLPVINDKGTALAFHWGVDRLLKPPFSDSGLETYALRPMNPYPGAWRVPYGEVRGLPFGATLAFAGEGSLGRLPRETLGNITVEGEGPERLTLEVLDQMVQEHLKPGSMAPPVPAIRLEGLRSTQYRVTIFTAGGHVTAFVADAAKTDSKDGRITLASLLRAELGARGPEGETPKVYLPLRVATALDLRARFPVLVEADMREEATGDPLDFKATHANHEPFWLELDRRFATWFKVE